LTLLSNVNFPHPRKPCREIADHTRARYRLLQILHLLLTTPAKRRIRFSSLAIRPLATSICNPKLRSTLLLPHLLATLLLLIRTRPTRSSHPITHLPRNVTQIHSLKVVLSIPPLEEEELCKHRIVLASILYENRKLMILSLNRPLSLSLLTSSTTLLLSLVSTQA